MAVSGLWRNAARTLQRSAFRGMLFGLFLLPVAALGQNHGGSVLVLKDPTPREPDLDKIYNPPPKAADSSKPAAIAAFNQRRFELIRRASGQIVSLAALLQRSLQEHRQGTPLKPQAEVAGAIELLSGNICAALTARPANSATPQVRPENGNADTGQLTAEVADLTALSAKLNEAVTKSEPDALPVGILLTSARVRDLAHGLKSQMQGP